MSERVLVRGPVVFAFVLVCALALGAAFAAAAGNPETQNRGPGQDEGYFLGHPTPTYSWHGCTKTSTFKTSVTRPAGMPPHYKGTKQGKVTWKTSSSASATATGGVLVKWEIDKKWKICGVQAAVRGAHPDAPADLVMMAGYTSGKKKGNTVKSGKETIKVRVKKSDAKTIGLRGAYGNKTYKIVNIYSVAVFFKKK